MRVVYAECMNNPYGSNLNVDGVNQKNLAQRQIHHPAPRFEYEVGVSTPTTSSAIVNQIHNSFQSNPTIKYIFKPY